MNTSQMLAWIGDISGHMTKGLTMHVQSAYFCACDHTHNIYIIAKLAAGL